MQSIVFTDSNAPVENWQERNVGMKAITVIGVEASNDTGTIMSLLQSLMSLLQSLSREVSMLKEREVTAWTPRIRNAAAQLLLHACGQQSFRQTGSDWFQQLGPEDKGVEQLAQAMHVPAARLVVQADSVLTRCNAHIHPGSQQALDEEVSAVVGVLTPAMESAMPWECRFLRAYQAVKQAFPQHFS
mmetsp:Transcript_8258/g.24931  ORF Transcript_8258/g.24931 Transcript_8258/m.24931 type:complete len:187 (+) Transcript_8258:379-939(+)|eukprot:364163-Chlamydomonas_euryale.AAC.21